MMDMDDYGVIWLIETLDEEGALSLMDLKLKASETFKDGEWSDYLDACFEFLKFKKRILPLGAVGSLWTISEEVRPKPPVEPLDPNRTYCARCFHISAKLVWMKALGDTSLHMCPDCGDSMSLSLMSAQAYCTVQIIHYQILKAQIEEELLNEQ